MLRVGFAIFWVTLTVHDVAGTHTPFTYTEPERRDWAARLSLCVPEAFTR